MIIHGKDIRFALTVGASAEIAALCPGGDLRKVGEMLGDNYAASVEFAARFIVALNRGHAQSVKWETGVEAETITAEEVLSLPAAKFGELQQEAMASFRADAAGEIETEPEKGKKGEGGL